MGMVSAQGRTREWVEQQQLGAKPLEVRMGKISFCSWIQKPDAVDWYVSRSGFVCAQMSYYDNMPLLFVEELLVNPSLEKVDWGKGEARAVKWEGLCLLLPIQRDLLD